MIPPVVDLTALSRIDALNVELCIVREYRQVTARAERIFNRVRAALGTRWSANCWPLLIRTPLLDEPALISLVWPDETVDLPVLPES